MPPIALITGSTAGIGEATATLLYENGFDVILNGRRMERLEALKAKLEGLQKGRIQLLHCDLTNRTETEAAFGALPDEWKQIDVLVNNAGLAMGRSPIQEGDPTDWDIMIDTNIKGLLLMSHLVMPEMIARSSGHIINIGSIAGKEVYANGNVYCATKHAVDALTKAMRIDLLPYNIKVTSIDPGNVETEFSIVRYKGDLEKAKKTYENYEPLHAEDIAEAILFAVTRPAHVCINDLVIMPTSQASTAYFQKTH